MANIYVCRGLPGSGKSTWARKFQEQNLGTVIVNRDTIRQQVFGYEAPNGKNGWLEQRVSVIETAMIDAALKNGFDVVIDNVNGRMPVFPPEHSVHQIWFDTSVEECIRRRSVSDRVVSRDVILGMITRYPHLNPSNPYDRELVITAFKYGQIVKLTVDKYRGRYGKIVDISSDGDFGVEIGNDVGCIWVSASGIESIK